MRPLPVLLVTMSCGLAAPVEVLDTPALGTVTSRDVDVADAGAADAGAVDAGPSPADCDDLPQQLEPARATALETSLRARGSPTLRAEHTDALSLFQSVGAQFDADDVAAGLVDLLVALDDSPFVADELETRVQYVFDAASIELTRTRAAGHPARFWQPAAAATVERRGDGRWELLALTLYSTTLFATSAEVERLHACTRETTAPPPAVGWSFSGLTFEGCAVTGSYQYTSRPGDTLRWGRARGRPDGVWWEPRNGRWRLLRPATLTIAPENWWPDIAAADCICDGVAGYELLVDTVSGEYSDVTPAINCVVC